MTAVPVLDSPGRAVEAVLARPVTRARTAAGLDVLAVRLPTVPLVEVRLVVPLLVGSAAERARLTVLAAVLDAAEVGSLRAVGGSLRVIAGNDQFQVQVTAPADALPAGLAALRTLVAAEPAAAAVGRAAAGLRGRLPGAAAHPLFRTRVHLLRAVFGDQAAAQEVPTDAELAEVTATGVAAARDAVLRPDRAVLVLVGDLDPEAAVAAAGPALADWAPGPHRPPDGVPVAGTSGVRVVEDARPGSVHLRLAAPVAAGVAAGAAAELASVAAGGPVRWAGRLRGIAYEPACTVQYVAGTGLLTLTADGTAEQAAALVAATAGCLAELASDPPTGAEVAAARAYATGRLVLSLGSQGGCASTLAALAVRRRGPDGIGRHLRALGSAPDAAVAATAAALASRVTGAVIVPPGGATAELAAAVRTLAAPPGPGAGAP